MGKRTISISISFLILLANYGCSSNKNTGIAPDIATSDEALFKLGERFIKKDPDKARIYFRQVIDSFPYSFYAQRAKLAIADSYFEKGDEGNMIIAASEYRKFITLYPVSPSASYAQHQLAMTFYIKALKPGLDQTKTRRALAEFTKLVTNYPLSDESQSAREKINDCRERLAEHTFQIGKYYYKVKAYKGSIPRLLEITTRYPNYSKMDKVYFLLGDSYCRWNKMDQGIPYFRKLISDFPQSRYAKKAARKLKEREML